MGHSAAVRRPSSLATKVSDPHSAIDLLIKSKSDRQSDNFLKKGMAILHGLRGRKGIFSLGFFSMAILGATPNVFSQALTVTLEAPGV